MCTKSEILSLPQILDSLLVGEGLLSLADQPLRLDVRVDLELVLVVRLAALELHPLGRRVEQLKAKPVSSADVWDGRVEKTGEEGRGRTGWTW